MEIQESNQLTNSAIVAGVQNGNAKFEVSYIPILLGLLTAFLFVIGYLVETVSLEKFGLFNSELMPDTSTAITLGFRYVFINSVGGVAVGCIYVITALLLTPPLKSTFDDVSTVKKWGLKVLSQFNVVLVMYRPIRTLIIIFSLIFCPILIWMHAVDQASNNALELLESSVEVDVVTLKTKPVSKREGKVLRIRNNIVIFRDYKNSATLLLPIAEIQSIQYYDLKPFVN